MASGRASERGLSNGTVLGTRFERGIELARSSGMEVRYEYLHGQGGGVCQVQQRAQLFVDLALDPWEQLQALESAMRLVMEEQWPVPGRAELERWVARL